MVGRNGGRSSNGIAIKGETGHINVENLPEENQFAQNVSGRSRLGGGTDGCHSKELLLFHLR